MPDSKPVPFDVIAPEYDDVFSRSLIGRYQRNVTRKYLQRFLTGRKKLKILEINCGTGEDAFWLASLGHTVVATDKSEGMISAAQNKISDLKSSNLQFTVCAFNELETLYAGGGFDLVLSNFSGL